MGHGEVIRIVVIPFICLVIEATQRDKQFISIFLLQTWYAKTPLGKKRAKAAAGDDEGDKKGKKGGKKGGKKKKK